MKQPISISRRRFLALTGVAAYAGIVQPAQTSANTIPVASTLQITGTEVPALASFDNTMSAFMLLRSISAGALAVTYQGRLVFARGYTNSDTNTDLTQPTSLFRVASLSKPLASAAIMILVQENKLSLDTRLVDLIALTPPPGHTADIHLSSITIRHLLQHLGGWDRDLAPDPTFNDQLVAQSLGIGYPLTRSNIITYATGQPLQHTPGTTFAYCNYGYLLLGEIIERLSGQPYEQFILQRVLNPMDIYRMRLGHSAQSQRFPDEVTYRSLYTHTSVLDNSGAIVPFPYGGFNLEVQRVQGGWIASPVELLKFATAFDLPRNGGVLTPASIETIFAQPSIGPNQDGHWYGLGWAVRNAGTSRNTWHDGSQPGSSTLMVRRWDGLAWAVVFNQRENSRDPNGQSYGQIDDALHIAANQVTTWPDNDLFSHYLPVLTEKVLLPIVRS